MPRPGDESIAEIHSSVQRSTVGKWIPERLRRLLKHFMLKRSLIVSQCGQDFWIYAEAFNEKRQGYFVDIGAHNGTFISNTYLLEKRYGWSGLCIEANPHLFEELQRNRKARCINVCLDRSEGEVEFLLRDVLGGIVDPKIFNYNTDEDARANEVMIMKTRPLLAVLDENDAPEVIDYLSIDVEGAEERILGGFDFSRYLFRCLTVEQPSETLHGLLETHGYVLLRRVPRLDSLYVHESFVEEYRKNLWDFYHKKHLFIRWIRVGKTGRNSSISPSNNTRERIWTNRPSDASSWKRTGLPPIWA